MNKNKHSLENSIKITLKGLSKLLDALENTSDQDNREILRLNSSIMQLKLMNFVDRAKKEEKSYPASHYYAIMCRACIIERDAMQADIDSNKTLNSKQELEENIKNLEDGIQYYAQRLVDISHPNCDGPHDVIIGDHRISID